MNSRARLATVLFIVTAALRAQDAAPTVESFDSLEAGPPPDSLMVVEGSWAVVAEETGKHLELQAEPVVDAALLIGPSLKAEGSVRAKIRAAKSRRAHPRFGVGLYGVSGVKLRVSPAQKKVELVLGDEVIAEAPFDAWTENAWWQVELKVTGSGESWVAEGRVWPDGSKAPERPTVSQPLTAAPGQGRASLLGAPYANKPIHFDDVTVGAPSAAAPAEPGRREGGSSGR